MRAEPPLGTAAFVVTPLPMMARIWVICAAGGPGILCRRGMNRWPAHFCRTGLILLTAMTAGFAASARAPS